MNDLTKGPIAGHLLRFASFIALTTAFQTLYLLIDLYFVGQLGREAIAGVGLSGNLMMIVLALTQSLGVGATALVAHAMGAKDRARAEVGNLAATRRVLRYTPPIIPGGPHVQPHLARRVHRSRRRAVCQPGGAEAQVLRQTHVL